MAQKWFYAGHNPYGINFAYNSPGWSVHAFPSKAERDAWVKRYCLDDSKSKVVAEAVTSQTAYKLAGVSGNRPPVVVKTSCGFILTNSFTAQHNHFE